MPILHEVTLRSGVDGLKTGGIGLGALVSVPVIMAIFAITLVGIPIAILGFLARGVALYLAIIIVASVVGRILLSSTERGESVPLTLLAGLVVAVIAMNIPGIGSVLGFVFTIVGLGLIVQLILEYISELGYKD